MTTTACIFHTPIHQTTMHSVFHSDWAVPAALLGREKVVFYRGVVMKMGKEVGVGYTLGVPKVRSNMEPIVGFFCFSLPVVVVVAGFIVVVVG